MAAGRLWPSACFLSVGKMSRDNTYRHDCLINSRLRWRGREALCNRAQWAAVCPVRSMCRSSTHSYQRAANTPWCSGSEPHLWHTIFVCACPYLLPASLCVFVRMFTCVGAASVRTSDAHMLVSCLPLCGRVSLRPRLRCRLWPRGLWRRRTTKALKACKNSRWWVGGQPARPLLGNSL